MELKKLVPVMALGLVIGGGGTAFAADTVKIGIAVALTGPLTPYAESEGMRCMADKVNKAAGADDPKVEILVEDNRSDAQLSVSLGQKFLDAGAQVITGLPFPDALIPMTTMAQSYNVTVYSAPNTQVEMQELGTGNFIAGAVPDPINAAATAAVAYAKGARKAVLLTSEDSGSWSAKLPEWFGDAFTKAGGQVVGKFSYNFGISDWSPQIASIKALGEKPDVIHVSGILPDIGILIRQLRANGYDGWIAGSDGFDDPSLEATVGKQADLDKVIFATHGVIGNGGAIDQFLKECKDAGFKVNGIFDALGGDMVAVIAGAAKKAGSVDPAKLRDAIRAEGGYKGVTAETISFAEKQSYPIKTVPVIGFADGKRALITEVMPPNIPYLK
ncbi:ABC transporter substrate-binding protein [Taklimakanibacter lacteus]|uniref:ABC transporter substrate-binding protein n=1 Tax=Taklimakanibacter lacteus TaxID=2268456 RepID=UPI000E66AC85